MTQQEADLLFQLYRALKEMEWKNYDDDGNEYCGVCMHSKAKEHGRTNTPPQLVDGHWEHCSVGLALAAADKYFAR